MLKTYQAQVENDGRIRLTESADLPPHAKVLVTIYEDEDTIGGIPVTMLLSQEALSDWLRPEEDEAWKDYQDKT